MQDPIIESCKAYANSPDIWKWVLFTFVVLTLASGPEGYAHWKRQKRLDKYFKRKPRKQGFKW
jgi:hypothetical protein